MKRLFQTVLVGACCGAVLIATADQGERGAEARAYMSLGFGGQALPKDFHYGLRLDYAQDEGQLALPAVFSMDFNRAGLSHARLGGLPLLGRNYAAGQAEGIAWLGGLTLAEVGIAAASVATVVVVANETSDDDEEAPPSGGDTTGGDTTGGDTTGGDTGGDTTGGGGTGGTGGTGGIPLGGITGYSTRLGTDQAERDPERQKWLDGGTGQMGDLGAK